MKWVVGDVTVTKVVELEVTGGTRFLLPQATREEILPIAWLRPHFADEEGRLRMSIHSFIVEAPDRRIIRRIHAWAMTKKKRRICTGMIGMGRFWLIWRWRDFRQNRSIRCCARIFMSIMSDGTRVWSTANGFRRFRAPSYLMGRAEYEHWRSVKDRPDMENIMADLVTPIVEAGLATMVETNARICEEISLVPTLGHTPGHVSVMIQSKGEQALITGDFMHHPCQIARPEWSTLADSDFDQGIETRRRMFQRLAGTPVLIIGTHFAGATAGRLVADGGGYRLDV